MAGRPAAAVPSLGGLDVAPVFKFEVRLELGLCERDDVGLLHGVYELRQRFLLGAAIQPPDVHEERPQGYLFPLSRTSVHPLSLRFLELVGLLLL